MIDLHMHTTASDGTCAPEELVRRAATAGIQVMSVTDHDTMAAVPPAASAAGAAGIAFVPGIEITATHAGRDVHILAYYLPWDSPDLDALLTRQRRLRIERALEIASRLDTMGAPVDVGQVLELAGSGAGKAIARPQLAQLLVAAGHVQSVAEAFERYLGEGCGAYVPHRGASPDAVLGLVAALGGIASLAHPGTLKRDHIIPSLVDAGLACIEAHHSAHDATTTAHYVAMARRLGVGVSGGSDFHGEGTRRCELFGFVGLPADDFQEFQRLARRASQHTVSLSR